MTAPVKTRVKIGLVPAELNQAQVNTLAYYWDRLQEHGAAQRRFPHGDVNDLKDFFSVVLNPFNQMFLVFDEERQLPCGEFMLTDFTGLAAQLHFSILPDYYRKGVSIARASLHQLFALKRQNSDLPCIHTLLGLTPVTNQLAVRFNRKVGFQELARIPMACYMHPDKYVDAVATIMTPDRLEEVENG